MNKYILISLAVILVIFLMIFAGEKPCKEANEKCLEYVLFNPEKNAYRWKFEFADEWYQTKEDAMDACLNVQKDIFCK